MPMWREYACGQCGRTWMVKDVMLAGRIVCADCTRTDRPEPVRKQ